MFGLCVAEPYYRLGRFRVEYFPSEEHLTAYRAKLDQRVTSWLVGEPEPKRRMIEFR